jgi:hypothetical protein
VEWQSITAVKSFITLAPGGSMGTEYFLQLLSLISEADFTLTIGLYYKHITIINDDSSVVNKR